MNTPIQLDPAVVVQVELAIIGATLIVILRVGWLMWQRLMQIDGTLNGPQGEGDGLVGDVRKLCLQYEAQERLSLRRFMEYIGWRRRIESAIKAQDPTFEITSEKLLLDMLTGESPE